MALTDKLTDIADAIRGKTGGTEPLTLAQMPGEIAAIKTDPVLQELAVTENGEYTPREGVDGFSRVTVDVAGEIPERTAWYRPPDWPDITRLPLDGVTGYYTVDKMAPGAPDKIDYYTIGGGSFAELGDMIDGEFVPVQRGKVGTGTLDLTLTSTNFPVIAIYSSNHYTNTAMFDYSAPIVESYTNDSLGKFINQRSAVAITAGADGTAFASGGLAARGIPSANLRYLDLSRYTGYNATTSRSLYSIFSGFKALTVLRFPTVPKNSVLLTVASQSDWPDSAFNGCESLLELDMSIFDTSEVTRLNSTFAGCTSLHTLNLSGWNLSACTKMQNTFQNCTALVNLITDGATMPPVSFSLSDSTALSVDSLIGVIAALPVLADGATATLTLGATNMAKLTADQIAVATEKGWTVA